jgi:C4-dicarboxylate transporter, DctM subunit
VKPAAAENLLLSAVLLLLVVAGVASADIWRLFGIDLVRFGPEELVRHLTLALGLVGGAVAARDGRLLSFAGAVQLLPAPLQRRIAWLPGLVGCCVAAALAAAGIVYLQLEARAAPRLASGLPLTLFLALLPTGFAVMALRIAGRASDSRYLRLAIMAAGLLVAFALLRWPGGVVGSPLPALALLGVAVLLGAPIFVAVGGATLVLFWSRGDPIASIALDYYDQVTNPLLATLPMFTLTGYVLAESGAAGRLVRLFTAWTGHLRGGAAAVTALCCAFFTAFTGGSGVTILALGGLLMPLLLAAGYRDRPALGLLTGAGSLGVLLPPCLPLILYSIVAQVSLEDMFLAGILPTALLVGMTIAWGRYAAPSLPSLGAFDLRAALRATWEARWEIVLPAVPLVLILGGYMLPVPAAAVTVAFAFGVQLLVYRDQQLRARLVPMLVECGTLVGGVLLILGTAMGLTNFLVTVHVPDQLAALVGSNIEQRWLFLLALNFLLIGVGCLMDIFSAIIVVVPLIVPLAPIFGIDPLHLGVIVLANLELGYLTPPVGLNLYLSAYRFDRPVMAVARSVLPMLFALLAGVLLITYWPALTLWLPQQLGTP